MAGRTHTPPLIIDLSAEGHLVTNWDGRQQPDLADPPQLPDSLKLGTYREGVLQAPTPESCCPPNCDEECCRLQPPQKDHRSSSPSSFSVSSYGSNDSTEPLIQRQQPSRSDSPSGSGIAPLDGASIRCGCHVKVEDKTTKKARNKLIIACVIALLFMIAEAVGGYLAHSLAILTDAAHMLSDFASFLISLFAIWIGTRPPSKRFNFGWHRAEVVGAVVSVLIIWVLTGVLVYEAVLRCIHQNFEIDADVMLITACGGVFVNVFMMAVLGHSHGGHGHSHGGGGHGHSHGGGGHGHSHGGSGAEEEMDHSASPSMERKGRRKSKVEHQNINVRAAFIHVIGDLIQSIGVVLAGYIIWFKPEWKLADPVCTFLFSILVLFSTINVLRDALRVLMEGTPKHINYEELKQDLVAISGVKQAHSLHVWSLTMNRTAASAHLAIEPGFDSQDVLDRASHMLKEKYGIQQSTLQVENYQSAMSDCHTCQSVKKPPIGRRLSMRFWQNGGQNVNT